MPKIMYNGKNYSMGIGAEPDNELNEFSENPIQNKVVTEALNNKLNISDISEWAKAETKPEYTPEEVGADEKGSADTALDSAKSYVDDKISDLINGAPETLDTLKEVANAIEENETVVEALNTAIGTKANSSDLTAHINDKNNPHNVSKTDVGLGNVENKSSADIRGELNKEDVTTALGYTPPTSDTTYSAVTGSSNGLATPDLLSKATNAVPKSGTTMTGALVGQANADYTTAQFRNITMSTSAPSGGSNGQVHFQYS